MEGEEEEFVGMYYLVRMVEDNHLLKNLQIVAMILESWGKLPNRLKKSQLFRSDNTLQRIR